VIRKTSVSTQAAAGRMSADLLRAHTSAASCRAVPFHYGLWRDADYGEGATLDPRQFAATYGRLNPGGRVHILEPAARVVIGADGLAG
jgi:L-ascorbate metabolism protein UlaG (beta-lactamase superfamily)